MMIQILALKLNMILNPVMDILNTEIYHQPSRLFGKPTNKGQHQSIANDDIRYFNIDICTSEKKDLVICSSDKTFEDVLNEAFIFARETPEQFFIVNLGSKDIKQVEKVMDKVCKVHTELTAGTDEYVELKCPFIYKHEKGPWPSIGELVNYNPEQAQWEGDGELVGVRTKMLFTTSSKDGYTSPYFTPTFWREFQGSGLNELKQELKKGCRVPAGGIKLNAYSSEDYTPAEIEELILDRSGCNLNDSPLNTFISIVSQNKYEKNLDYLKELKDRLMEVNFAKWNGDYELVKPSSLVRRVQRDEL
ncbi:unnamed protein product [Rhizopus stolonifer]